jgi:quinolinate synthase
MKLNTLQKVLDTLRSPRPEQEITLPEDVLVAGVKALDRMLEMAGVPKPSTVKCD